MVQATSNLSSKRIMTCYMVAVSLVALLSVGGFFAIDTVVQKESHASTLINISGRQRRLTLAIAYYCSQLVSQTSDADRAVTRKRLLADVDLMQQSHEALVSGSGKFGIPGEMSQVSRNQYFGSSSGVDAQVRTYLKNARAVASTPNDQLLQSNDAIKHINAEGPQRLVGALDDVVREYQAESAKQIEDIKNTELLLLALTLILLAAEAGVIFAPMSHTIDKQIHQLVDSQKELNAVFNTVGDALIACDAEDTIIDANEQVRHIFGKSSSEIIGKKLSNLLESSATSNVVAGADSGGTALPEGSRFVGSDSLGKHVELLVKRDDGTSMPCEMVITKTKLLVKELYIASIRDTSERKLAEEKIGEFYGVVAHELRSPMASIQGSLLLMKGGAAGTLNERGAKLVDASVEASQRLTRLIDDYLDLRKIASGNFELNKAVASLHEIATIATAGLQSMASNAEVNLQVTGDEEDKALCDRDSIVQVVTNLVSNAIKFSPKESSVHISIGQARNPGAIRCSVIDQGPGIPVAEMPRLFNMFQQTSSASMIPTKGTGLGLAISKALIEKHGGVIGVDVMPERGTVFWFELPVADGQRRA